MNIVSHCSKQAVKQFVVAALNRNCVGRLQTVINTCLQIRAVISFRGT
jgi:hypothetical protein